MDLIPMSDGKRVPMVGGGPANTAKAVAKLGYGVSFVGGISTDDFGKAIERELANSGVDLSTVYRGHQPTALAIATFDENGLTKYDFELEATASFAFDQSWLPAGEPEVIHVGSVSTLLEPGSSELLAWAKKKSAPIVFDPNVRPSIQENKELYREAVERWINISSIVKLSEDDMKWLYGEEDVVTTFLSRGVSIVIVTRAEKGLTAYRDGSVIYVPAVKVQLVDSVGAGDTVGAIIIEGLIKHSLDGLKADVLRQVLERAARAAGITCSRAGANPPWKEELDLAL